MTKMTTQLTKWTDFPARARKSLFKLTSCPLSTQATTLNKGGSQASTRISEELTLLMEELRSDRNVFYRESSRKTSEDLRQAVTSST